MSMGLSPNMIILLMTSGLTMTSVVGAIAMKTQKSGQDT
jgi:hypothetical protein